MSPQRIGSRWTTLPPIALLGVGTPMVESLEHYLSRLAFTSGIPLGRLYHELREGTSDGSSARTIAVNGVGDRVASLVSSLSAMTGCTILHCGTFQNLRHVLNTYGVEYRSKIQRWCPLCFGVGKPEPQYEPLVWRISSLTHCAVHHCALVDRCPACNRHQWLPSSYEQRRVCKHCRASLASTRCVTVGGVYADHVARCAQELVGMCADPQQAPISLRDIQPFFDEVRATLMRARVAGERPEDLTILPFVEFGRLTLRRFTELCAIQGVGPRDILLRPKESGGTQLLPSFIPNWTYEASETTVGIRISMVVESLRYLQRPKRLKLFLPSISRLLHIARVGRNVFSDAARLAHRAYRESYRVQGTTQSLRDGERALSLALVRVRKRSFPPSDQMQLRWCAYGISRDCKVSTIVTRKCVRTALWLVDLESQLRAAEDEPSSAIRFARRLARHAFLPQPALSTKDHVPARASERGM